MTHLVSAWTMLNVLLFSSTGGQSHSNGGIAFRSNVTGPAKHSNPAISFPHTRKCSDGVHVQVSRLCPAYEMLVDWTPFHRWIHSPSPRRTLRRAPSRTACPRAGSRWSKIQKLAQTSNARHTECGVFVPLDLSRAACIKDVHTHDVPVCALMFY